MSRTNQILAAVLALQVVLVAVVFWPRPAASIAGGEKLFPDLEAEQVVRLTLSDAEGNQIELAKGAEGWVLPEADDYATEGTKAPDFLTKIVELRTNRLVTQTPGSHRRLKVASEDFERLVEFELADGTTHKLYLGTSPSYNVTHVRADGQDEVYLASGLAASDAGVQASNWVNTLYYSVIQDQIVAVTLENANGRFEFEKDEGGTWTMKGLAADEKLLENNVKSLVTRVALLRMIRPLGKTEKSEYGLGEPSAVVTIQTRDDEGKVESLTLRVGARSEEDDGYVVISSESPYYVRVAGYSVEDYLEKTWEDFLEPPPTPTPESSSGG
ncbi:MAG: DUF4340 domain-containing protein [Anaerolineae bacterium]|nr:MAG: DUF4340 domain-containing protein [Anaerolineae bacterium]